MALAVGLFVFSFGRVFLLRLASITGFSLRRLVPAHGVVSLSRARSCLQVVTAVCGISIVSLDVLLSVSLVLGLSDSLQGHLL